MESIDAFIDRLPKVELHLHLVGSASVPTVLELARRHPDGPGAQVPRTAEELAAFYEFRDFPHFANVYGAVSSLVREPADVAALVLGAARDLAGQNVRYAELTVTPYTHTAAGMPAADLTEALDIAARSAVADHGVRIAYVFDIASELGEPAARGTLDHALSFPPEALTGFGLGGIEQARPSCAGVLRSAFASAIAAGLHSVPHAGEMSGPATIWEALTGLRAERIGHGISCLDDPALVARLRETQVPLEVCPTSNVCTRQVAGLTAHPLPRLLAEGLFVTLNSDDPPMFGTTLTEEYRRVASVLGFGRLQLAELAANGVRASFLDAAAKRELLAEISAVASGAAGSVTGVSAETGRGRPLRQEREIMTTGEGDGPPGGGEHTPRAVTAQDWLLRILPLGLLIVVGLAGLRGMAATPRWNGPLHDDALAVGAVLEVLILAMLAILLRRRTGSGEATAVKLRGVLIFVLSAGAIAAAVLMVVGLHLRAVSRTPQRLPGGSPRPAPSLRATPPHQGTPNAWHLPLTALLYALLIVALLAGVALSLWWARRLSHLPIPARDDGDFIVEDPQRLRAAVESGRSALRTVDDARAAIIACYLAMETSLAERGTARGVAGTPGELLTRAEQDGLVRGTAAGRLTALFYEARFSSHPLGPGERDAAERALNELAADLAETKGVEAAGAGG